MEILGWVLVYLVGYALIVGWFVHRSERHPRYRCYRCGTRFTTFDDFRDHLVFGC